MEISREPKAMPVCDVLPEILGGAFVYDNNWQIEITGDAGSMAGMQLRPLAETGDSAL